MQHTTEDIVVSVHVDIGAGAVADTSCQRFVAAEAISSRNHKPPLLHNMIG